ncbi:DNA polymerase III subunit beta [Spirochaetia bacterium]|nr:DNA polymerase III subunit beta [Spirochaetia bacterium]
MKFVCNKNNLLKEFGIAQEIVLTKNALSILSNIYLETSDNFLIIKSTDVKINFVTKVPVNVIEEGKLTIKGDILLGILNSIPDGEIEFFSSDTNMVVKPAFKKTEFKIKSTSTDQYPQFPSSDNAYFFELPVKDFKEMITQTIFSVSDDESRIFMNGIFFEKSDNILRMVSTDGRRLAYSQKVVDDSIKEINSIIIPEKILNVFLKRAGEEGNVSIGLTDKNIFINFGSYGLSSVLIDGQFPNYKKVIPEDQKYTFTLKRKDMLDALKRVALMVEKNSKRAYFHLTQDKLVLYTEENELGALNEEMDCTYGGEEITFALNFHFVEDPLKIMDKDDVAIQFKEPNKAITIKTFPDSDYFFVVMPMQID